MSCADFQNCLTDYIEGQLEGEQHRRFAEHVLRCPLCHDTLAEVRYVIEACRKAAPPPPSIDLEAKILAQTTSSQSMTCAEFEEFLTDYLDGFLPAPLYHRWERHASMCNQCTELPGEVVRSIGACYTYMAEEQPLPEGLHEQIMEATLGTVVSHQFRAPVSVRIGSLLRYWLDPIVSPHFATVATMLLVAVLVLTNTVSADGSIGGVYRASLRLAEQSYSGGSDGGIRQITNSLKQLVGANSERQERSGDGSRKDK